jgi:MFS family permease
MPSAPNSSSIWTRAFALLCLAEFLGYAQHFMLQPALPLYITQLGGTPLTVGIVIAAFGVTSVISRPIIGYWVDRWSETGMMTLGMIGQALSIVFCFIPFNTAVVFSNALRGIAWSSMAASGYTLLASAAPQARRGEASGYFGGVQSSATIIFPAISLWILDMPDRLGAIARDRATISQDHRRCLGALVARNSQCRRSPYPQRRPADFYFEYVVAVFFQLRRALRP